MGTLGTEQQTSIVSAKLNAEKSKTCIYTRKTLKIRKGHHISHRQAINTANDCASKCLEPKDEGAVLLLAIVGDVQQP